MPKRPQKVTNSRRSALKLEALEQRQLFAGGFTAAQGTEFSNIQHPNGNIYDQVLMKTASITVTADPGQVTRVSFLDPQGDIVQAEFSGAGSLSISLANPTGPAAPTKYNQPDIQYMQGLASFTIQGADSSTNFSVFSVGSATANGGAANPIFSGGLTGGDNLANVQRITIVANPANPNGSTFGGLRAGNALFTGDTGVVGIAAANVQVQDVVTVGDIDATGSATPTLVFGTASQFGTVTVAGGDLLSTNGNPINNNGSYLYKINLTAGGTSGGTVINAATTSSQISFTGVNPIQAAQKTFTLTTGVDTVVGTTGDDIINGQIGATGATFTPLDSVDGGAGNDQLVVNDITGGTALPGGLSIKNVEAMNFATVGIASFDTSTGAFSGLKTVNVLQSTGADTLTIGKDQAVTVFDTAGKVTITGGTSQTVTTVGGVALSGATGAIKVTDTNQGATASTITGGSTNDVTTTVDNNAPGALTIGGATTLAPTGAVTAVYNLQGDTTYAAARTGGAITVTGGTTITVTENALGTTNVLTTAGINTTQALSESAISITGSTATTSVTVNQTAEQTNKDTVVAVAATTEVATVQFAALTAGQTITLGGVTYTAPAAGATAADVAKAFANLGSGQTAAGATGSSWTTGAVTGANTDTVVFTAAAAGAQTDLANTGTGAATVSLTTAGTASASAAGRTQIKQGTVTIADANGAGTTDTITSVTLSNYGWFNSTDATVGNSTITSDALTSLTIAGNVGPLAVVNTAATTLDLNLNKASNSSLVSSNGNQLTLPTYTTIKIHTGTVDNSTIKTLTTAAATALTVDGSKSLTITDAIGATIKTVGVSGAAGLTLTAAVPATVTGVDASTTSGSVTVTLADPTATTYTGGTGTDKVTVAAAPTKAITGGAGTDTFTINVAAGTFSNPSTNSNITGFEVLGLGSAATGTYDATGFTGLTVGAVTGPVVFSNVAAGAGLTLTGVDTDSVTYQLKDATGSADSLAITLNGTAATNAANPVVAPSIESVSIASGNANTTVTTNTLTLQATAATSLTITGAKPLVLTNTGNTALTSIDGSAMTGALTVTAAGTVAESIKGGSGNDVLTASTGSAADTLIGNAGNDMLVANAGLDTLTGGAGGDTFVAATPTANVNTYSTITDMAVGDVLQLKGQGVETFGATKVVLGDTAVFQDYANFVVTQGGAGALTNGYIGWFQFGGNTYVVESLHSDVAQPGFVNATDIVVKLSGLVDLSTSTFLQNGAGAPEIILR